MNDGDNIIIVGDMNCRDINWNYDVNDQLVVCNADELSNKSSRFIEILDSHNLSQYNSHPTCNNAVLDLVLTDGVNAVCTTSENATSTHQAIDVSVNIPCASNPTTTPRTVYVCI